MNKMAAIEIAEHERTFEQIANIRHDIRTAEQYAESLTLATGEHKRYAYLAMAALGQRHDEDPSAYLGGSVRLVGPYITDAVQYVLRGVQHSEADRRLVFSHAALINVVARV